MSMTNVCMSLTNLVKTAVVSSLRRSPQLRIATTNQWRYLCTEKSVKQDASSAPIETPEEEPNIKLNINPEQIDKLKAENEKLTGQVKDLEDKYKRALAESENVRQRMLKQVQEAKQFGIQGFCKDLLSVADTLSLATENATAEQLENQFVKSMHEGLKLTETQLHKVFSDHGVKLISPEGEKFDPNYHEALFEKSVPDKGPGTVFIVTKKGYTLNERVLRPALVGVVKAP